MIRAPPEETIMPFGVHGLKAHSREHNRRIRHAWKNVSLKRKLEAALIAQTSPREGTSLEQPLGESTNETA
ncbi:hypothetical protein CR513_43144, partial [Mucuna pruriens]